MLINIGVITCPGRHYIHDTLKSLRCSFDIAPTIFNDSNRKGAMYNWLRAVECLSGTADYLLICEDDIELRPEAAFCLRSFILEQYDFQLEKVDIPKTSFMSLYCSLLCGRESVLLAGGGWAKLNRLPHGWCGSLAICLPQRSVDYVLQNREKLIDLSMSPGGNPIHLDYAIHETLRDIGPAYAHMPTMVYHTGDVSTYSPNNTDNALLEKARSPCLPL